MSEEKDKEAMLQLAKAMSKLADSLDKFQDPVIWQKIISDAARTLPGYQPRLPSIRLEEVTVSLSDEERHRLTSLVYEKVKPQLQEFNQFVKQSLEEMPPHRLKEIAEKVERGAAPRLGRAHGCIYLEAEDRRVYLGL